MIRSFIFRDGKMVGENVDSNALRLAREDKETNLWVDLEKPTDEEVKFIMEDLFQFHPLAIADCLAVGHFPKIEEYDDHLFFVMQTVDLPENGPLRTIGLKLFLGCDFLVTCHRDPPQSLAALRERLAKKGAVKRSVARLAYGLIDAAIERFDPVLDSLNKSIAEMEDTIFDAERVTVAFSRQIMRELRVVRGQVTTFRRLVGRQKELIHRIAHGEFDLIPADLLPYFRDIYDNLVRIDDAGHQLNDQLFLSFDVWLNRSANETNEIIKLLTLLTVITTPTVLIGTWYGMNFPNMPELHWQHGYEIAGAVTILSTLGLVVWMKLKKWL